MKRLLALLCFIPFAVSAQKDSVMSGAYNWQQPEVKENKITSIILLEGKVHDFEWMQLTANSLGPSPERMQMRVPKKQEQLIIVKSGMLLIGLGDSTFALNPNSVAVLMPGQRYLLNSTQPCSFYIMKYRSKSPIDRERGKTNGGSFVKFWDAISYKPNNIGAAEGIFLNAAPQCKNVLKCMSAHSKKAGAATIRINTVQKKSCW